MNKGAFAKEEVMEEYLSALLTDISVDDKVQKDSVAKLLETAVPEKAPQADEVIEEAKVIDTQVEKEGQAQGQTQATEEHVRDEEFQALFFEVAGLTMAVPLTELGGIHNLEKVGPLFGKPDWFQGVMLHREEKLSVVDTAKWVMPEKYDEKLAENLNYQYLIMLDDSDWGLASEKLVNTVTLQPGDVKWREAHGKRPWLAGLVKEKMCALINVRQLIAMLDQGQGSNDK